MTESQKRFWVCTNSDGKKEVVWNWEHNMHAGIYPEYKNIEWSYETRQQAERAASTSPFKLAMSP